MSDRTTSEKAPVRIELEDLETPVVPLHPAFGEARSESGQLRVRTDLRAGLHGNIVQTAPSGGG
jgi:hypothetical protein